MHFSQKKTISAFCRVAVSVAVWMIGWLRRSLVSSHVDELRYKLG